MAAHHLRGVIADPSMGGGTPLIEANRLGFHVVGTDINPMAYWIVRQSFLPLQQSRFRQVAGGKLPLMSNGNYSGSEGSPFTPALAT
ncbi:MAG: hypothetical protein HYY04_18040 [Chloroflexi bacterium]|nr:hypothetical protein [Chloroflexota bacterium]